ncbi:hypothetical protein DFJ73DRAFT_852192 [Zopfochytrium polystomum]|nr:hypothetical protein DFJ73DRAFT_852192 [Zopfochytrium polystomum]
MPQMQPAPTLTTAASVGSTAPSAASTTLGITVLPVPILCSILEYLVSAPRIYTASRTCKAFRYAAAVLAARMLRDATSTINTLCARGDDDLDLDVSEIRDLRSEGDKAEVGYGGDSDNRRDSSRAGVGDSFDNIFDTDGEDNDEDDDGGNDDDDDADGDNESDNGGNTRGANKRQSLVVNLLSSATMAASGILLHFGDEMTRLDFAVVRRFDSALRFAKRKQIFCKFKEVKLSLAEAEAILFECRRAQYVSCSSAKRKFATWKTAMNAYFSCEGSVCPSIAQRTIDLVPEAASGNIAAALDVLAQYTPTIEIHNIEGDDDGLLYFIDHRDAKQFGHDRVWTIINLLLPFLVSRSDGLKAWRLATCLILSYVNRNVDSLDTFQCETYSKLCDLFPPALLKDLVEVGLSSLKGHTFYGSVLEFEGFTRVATSNERLSSCKTVPYSGWAKLIRTCLRQCRSHPIMTLTFWDIRLVWCQIKFAESDHDVWAIVSDAVENQKLSADAVVAQVSAARRTIGDSGDRFFEEGLSVGRAAAKFCRQAATNGSELARCRFGFVDPLFYVLLEILALWRTILDNSIELSDERLGCVFEKVEEITTVLPAIDVYLDWEDRMIKKTAPMALWPYLSPYRSEPVFSQTMKKLCESSSFLDAEQVMWLVKSLGNSNMTEELRQLIHDKTVSMITSAEPKLDGRVFELLDVLSTQCQPFEAAALLRQLLHLHPERLARDNDECKWFDVSILCRLAERIETSTLRRHFLQSILSLVLKLFCLDVYTFLSNDHWKLLLQETTAEQRQVISDRFVELALYWNKPWIPTTISDGCSKVQLPVQRTFPLESLEQQDLAALWTRLGDCSNKQIYGCDVTGFLENLDRLPPQPPMPSRLAQASQESLAKLRVSSLESALRAAWTPSSYCFNSNRMLARLEDDEAVRRLWTRLFRLGRKSGWNGLPCSVRKMGLVSLPTTRAWLAMAKSLRGIDV